MARDLRSLRNMRRMDTAVRTAANESFMMKPDRNGQAGRTWKDCIAQIKSELPLSATIGSLAGVTFMRQGPEFKSLCPFHSEKTPSFFVNDESGRYKCFGAGCEAHGDVIEFIRRWEQLSFFDAVHRACQLANIQPPQTDGYSQGPSAQQTWPRQTDREQVKDIPKPCLQSPLTLDRIEENLLPTPGKRVQVVDEPTGGCSI